MSENKLLIIDDESEICGLIADVASALGFSYVTATDRGQFEPALQKFQPTAITLDLMMPGVDGIEVIRRLAADKCTAKVLLMSGADTRIMGTARRLGTELGLDMVGMLPKPFEISALRASLKSVFVERATVTETEFLEALEKHQLVPYFQPKVALGATGTPPIDGAEMLVRWNHPRLGILTPDRFFPIIMRARLMNELTRAIVPLAFAEASRWRRDGMGLTVAVNLPADSLDDLELPNRLGDLAAKHEVPPSSIVLEITETAAMAEGSNVMDVVARLRLKGFGISLDDFGTGFSSLIRLYRFPFSELKIDRSFVKDAEDSREARAIVRATIALGHSIGMKICAEGVETVSMVELLRAEKCDKAQGYLFGRPMPPDMFVSFVRERLAAGGVRKTAS